MKYLLAAAVSALIALAQPALAQERTLQMDVNNLSVQALNGAGAPVPFGGLSHSGALHFTFTPQQTQLLAVLMRTGAGPFILQPSVGSLTGAMVHIDLSGGAVTGGNMMFDINGGPGGGGDRYSAAINASGNVAPFIQGGFQIEGVSSAGLFSDANFGGIDIADFFSAQGGAFLPGYYFAFRIQPNAQGAGTADMDVFVTNIPAPGSLLCLAAGGLVAMRRRR